jgi:hypothetical protein
MQKKRKKESSRSRSEQTHTYPLTYPLTKLGQHNPRNKVSHSQARRTQTSTQSSSERTYTFAYTQKYERSLVTPTQQAKVHSSTNEVNPQRDEPQRQPKFQANEPTRLRSTVRAKVSHCPQRTKVHSTNEINSQRDEPQRQPKPERTNPHVSPQQAKVHSIRTKPTTVKRDEPQRQPKPRERTHTLAHKSQETIKRRLLAQASAGRTGCLIVHSPHLPSGRKCLSFSVASVSIRQ